MEMLKHYFVVFELPGGEELRFTDDNCSPKLFWENVTDAVGLGNTSIIISREDTGVCEEFWKHVATLKKFTTFVLVHLDLYQNEAVNHFVLHKKFAGISSYPQDETVIDAAHNFQLVTIDA